MRRIDGTINDETLHGGRGIDIISGNFGADTIYGKGGSDIFVFNFISDSFPGHEDRLRDFRTGQDHIDLRGIDANVNRPGNQAFTGTDKFHHRAGELIYKHGALMGDVNGDSEADIVIHLHNSPFHPGDILP